MKRIRIIAPSYVMAKDYLNEMNSKSSCIMLSINDADKLRGLRSVDIVVINKEYCDKQLIGFLAVQSTVANLNVEYVNV